MPESWTTSAPRNWGVRFAYAVFVLLCLAACGLLALLPAAAVETDIIYRGF